MPCHAIKQMTWYVHSLLTAISNLIVIVRIHRNIVSFCVGANENRHVKTMLEN
jgi:hypothetical protein